MKLRYGKLFSIGGYQSERVELEVDFTDRKNMEDVYKWLVQQVHHMHSLKVNIDNQLKDGMEVESSKPLPNELSTPIQ